MLTILCALLLLNTGRCTDGHIFETETFHVGENVVLTCSRQPALQKTTYFWIRLLSENSPEFLGGTFSFDYDGVNSTPRITAKQQPEKFVLNIHEASLNDTGFYYCVSVTQTQLAFSKAIFLRIKGPEPDFTVVTRAFPLDPGDSVTLQCSVLSNSDNHTCSEEHSLFLFKAGLDESDPSLVYGQRNSDECQKSPEDHETKTCFFSDITSSGTYHCAVAACGKMVFGHGTKLKIEEWTNGNTFVMFVLLSAALAASLTAASIFICKKCCNAPSSLQRNRDGQKHNQTCEDTLVYSAVVFTVVKSGNKGAKDGNLTDRQRIYAAVKAFGLDQECG